MKYACKNLSCPERAPVEKPFPPTCYTCGRPMPAVDSTAQVSTANQSPLNVEVEQPTREHDLNAGWTEHDITATCYLQPGVLNVRVHSPKPSFVEVKLYVDNYTRRSGLIRLLEDLGSRKPLGVEVYLEVTYDWPNYVEHIGLQ